MQRFTIAILLVSAVTSATLADPTIEVIPTFPRAQARWVPGSNGVGTNYTLEQLPAEPTVFHINPFPQSPTVDGKLDEPFYQQAFKTEAFSTRDGQPGKAGTGLIVGYDPNGARLYFAAWCRTKSPRALRNTADPKQKDGPVEKGDHLHITFNDPTKPHTAELWVAPNGAIKDAQNGDVNQTVSGDVRTTIQNDAWIVEGVYNTWELTRNDIPEGLLKAFIPGKTMRIQVERKDQLTGQTTALAWPPDELERAPLFVVGNEEELNLYYDRLMFSRDMDVKLYAGEYWLDNADARARVQINSGPGGSLSGPFSMQLAIKQGERTITSTRIAPVESHATDFIIPVKELGKGEYTLTLDCYAGKKRIRSLEQRLIVKPSPDREEVEDLPATLTLTRPAAESLKTWHIRTGVPIRRGQLTDTTAVKLMRGDREVPVQAEALATWGPPGTRDAGSIRWLALDFVDSIDTGDAPTWELKFEKPAPFAPRLKVQEAHDRIVIDNGRLQLTINKAARGFNLFDAVTIDGKAMWESDQAVGPYVIDGKGVKYLTSNDQTADVRVEMQGPLAAVIRAEGWYVNPEAKHRRPVDGEPVERPVGGYCRHVTRIYVAADQPDVRVQQTFILTDDTNHNAVSDLAIDLPIQKLANVRFGGAKLQTSQNVFLRQTIHDHFDVATFQDDSINIVETGEQAPGTIQAGTLGIAVKHFCQNYPKELAALPNDGRMKVHFWPAHGVERVDQVETLTDDNAWRLPWVHSGQSLSFVIPPVLSDKTVYPRLHAPGYEYADSMFQANAIGVAKTHDVLISFESTSFEARAKVFNDQPHALADPHYIATTRAFGPITAAETEKHPLREHFFNNSMKWLIRAKNQYGSFGMWNWGDVQHFWRLDPQGKFVPQYRRLWAGTHHHYIRTPWLLYIRNGDPEIFDHARAHTQHIIDVDICHWTNGYFADREAQASYASHKRVGGLCDYKGLVHWNSGARNRYNSNIDFMLYDYYLTGNRRAWDIAMEHANYVRHNLGGPDNRGGAGQEDTLINLYEATWDESVGELMHSYARRLMLKTPADHNGLLDWTPWLTRYLDLTGDPRARDYLIDWVEHYGGRMYLHAYAYYITGEQKYADYCARKLLVRSLATVVRKDQYDGILGSQSKGWNDAVNGALLSLRAIEQAKLTMRDFQPDAWPVWMGWNISQPTMGRNLAQDLFKGAYPWAEDLPGQMRTTMYFYHDGSPKTAWLGFDQSIPTQDYANNIRVTSPSGELIKKVEPEGDYWVIRQKDREIGLAAKKLVIARGRSHVIRDGKRYDFKRANSRALLGMRKYESIEDLYALCGEPLQLGPNDARGFYKVVYDGSVFTPIPLLPPTGKVWIEVGPNSINTFGGFKFFYVPEDCEQFEIGFLPGYSPHRFRTKLTMAAGAILDPDLNAVASIACGLEYAPQVIEVKPKPEQRGKTWCIVGNAYLISHMKGVPPFLSSSFDAFAGEPHTPAY